MVRFAMDEIVGASFTAVTVSTKLSEAVSEPSLTVIVMVAVPERFAAGVTVTVREAALPPSTMFATGTSDVFEEPTESVRLPAAVCASPTVNAIAPVLVSSATDRLAISEMVGAVFTLLTDRVNESLALNEPSLTVTVARPPPGR